MDTRVYVLAKELGLSSKDLLAFFHDAGIEATSHMSMLSEKDCSLARKKFGKSADLPSVEDKKVVKKESKASSSTVKQKETTIAKTKAAPLEQNQKSTPNQEVNKLEKLQPVAGAKTHQGFTPQNDNQDDIFYEEPVRRPAELRAVSKEEEALLREVVEEAVSDGNKVLGLKGEDKFARRFAINKPPKRRSSRRRKNRKYAQEQETELVAVTALSIDKEMPLFEVATLMGKQSSELISTLLRQGKVCNKNQILSVDIIKNLAQQFGLEFSVTQPVKKAADVKKDLLIDGGSSRWPVVVIMGHVDHGKTSLLDYILKTKVAAREKGGITQHISVYQVESSRGKIVFLDTPGHEAFSYLRKRGARVTDIVVLVVAADDGVMPQTVEAIKHAQEAQVPIIVAMNKIDKLNGSPTGLETIKRQLAQHNLMAEDWGGDVIFAPVSAKTGEGVDNLLDMITLQAQMMELKGHAEQPGKAFIVESRLDKGYGPVATAICTEGTIKVGDHFVCGDAVGKVRLLLDPFGNRLEQAGPSTPVNIVGFGSNSGMSDWLHVVPVETYLKVRSGKRDEKSSATGFMQQQDPFAAVKNQITLMIKADTRGSLEAILHSIEKLSKEKKDIGCSIAIASSAIGDITENDIDVAESIGAELIGFSVKAEKNAVFLAKDKQVNVSLYGIIYELIEHIAKMLEAKKVIKKTWKKTGEAVVRKVFDIKGIGIIAGCYLREGICSRTSKVVCMRANKKMGEGKITSLQRDRKSVKEIHTGFEFAFSADAFNEWQEDDVVQCFTEVEAND